MTNMDPMGSCRVLCFRIHDEPTMDPVGNWGFAPSEKEFLRSDPFKTFYFASNPSLRRGSIFD